MNWMVSVSSFFSGSDQLMVQYREKYSRLQEERNLTEKIEVPNRIQHKPVHRYWYKALVYHTIYFNSQNFAYFNSIFNLVDWIQFFQQQVNYASQYQDYIIMMTTLYESSTQNINDNIREVWASQFRGGTFGLESITKSVMTAITLARGLTAHIYMASYALMFYPFLFERGITLLLFWMLICAIRSVVVNMVALVTGCILCSYHADLKPVCFEFSATKAIEMACSVYMWLSVNDYHIRLRSRRRSLVANMMLAKTTQISDSDLSLLSSDMSVASYMDFDSEIADPSEDSINVQAAVEWLMNMASGSKYANRLVDANATRAQRFLNMSAEELKELQNRIKQKLYSDVGIVDVSEQSSSNREISVTTDFSDTELSVGSRPNEGLEQYHLVSEPSTLDVMSDPSTSKKDIEKSFVSDEDGSKLNQRLGTQSTGSQTKQPSKKLLQRLSKEQMSKVLEPTQIPAKEIDGKNTSVARQAGISKSNSKERQAEEELKTTSKAQGILRSNPRTGNAKSVTTRPKNKTQK